jgi:peptidoglycan/xylan/chitin deacetylase (PgdA/CDA1 family)
MADPKTTQDEEQDSMVFCDNHPDIAAIDNCSVCGKAICYRCSKQAADVTVCGLKCALKVMGRSFITAAGRRFAKKPGRKRKSRGAWRRQPARVVLDTLLGLGLLFAIVRIWTLGRELKSAAGGDSPVRQVAVPDTSVRSVESVFRPTQAGMVTSNVIDVTGTAEDGRIVSLIVDGKPVRVQLAQDGRFSFERVRLNRGVTRIEVRALSINGDVSVLQVMTLTPATPTVAVLSRDFSRGSLSRKEVAFTFDGGSSDNASGPILDALKKTGTRATFFLTGEFIEKHPKTVKRIVAEGHDAGNHTWRHPHLTTYAEDRRQTTRPGITADRIKEELLKTASLFRSVTGRNLSPIWRAPYGEFNPEILRWAADAGFRHVGWTTGRGWAETMDTMDWVTDRKSKVYHSAEDVEKKILRFAETGKNGANGAVILMHLGTERRDDFPHEKLESILSGLIRMGYQPVKVSELMTQADSEPARPIAAAEAPEVKSAPPADTPITK